MSQLDASRGRRLGRGDLTPSAFSEKGIPHWQMAHTEQIERIDTTKVERMTLELGRDQKAGPLCANGGRMTSFVEGQCDLKPANKLSRKPDLALDELCSNQNFVLTSQTRTSHP